MKLIKIGVGIALLALIAFALYYAFDLFRLRALKTEILKIQTASRATIDTIGIQYFPLKIKIKKLNLDGAIYEDVIIDDKSIVVNRMNIAQNSDAQGRLLIDIVFHDTLKHLLNKAVTIKNFEYNGKNISNIFFIKTKSRIQINFANQILVLQTLDSTDKYSKFSISFNSHVLGTLVHGEHNFTIDMNDLKITNVTELLDGLRFLSIIRAVDKNINAQIHSLTLERHNIQNINFQTSSDGRFKMNCDIADDQTLNVSGSIQELACNFLLSNKQGPISHGTINIEDVIGAASQGTTQPIKILIDGSSTKHAMDQHSWCIELLKPLIQTRDTNYLAHFIGLRTLDMLIEINWNIDQLKFFERSLTDVQSHTVISSGLLLTSISAHNQTGSIGIDINLNCQKLKPVFTLNVRDTYFKLYSDTTLISHLTSLLDQARWQNIELNAKGFLALAEINSLQVNNLQFSAHNVEQIFTIDHVQGQLFDGTLEWKGYIDTRDKKCAGAWEARNIDIGALYSAKLLPIKLNIARDGAASLSGSSTWYYNKNQFINNLHSDFKLIARDLYLSIGDLDQVVNMQDFNTQEFLNAINAIDKKHETYIQNCECTGGIMNHKLKLTNISLRTNKTGISCNAILNLKDLKLDLNAIIAFYAKKDIASQQMVRYNLRLTAAGDVAKPNVSVTSSDQLTSN